MYRCGRCGKPRSVRFDCVDVKIGNMSPNVQKRFNTRGGRTLRRTSRHRAVRASGEGGVSLDHSDEDVRVHAIDALSSLNTSRALRLITQAFRDPSWKVRARAAERAAPLLAGKRVPRDFLNLLRDPHELVRVQTAESLAETGDVRTIRELTKSLRDRSPLVRSYAAASIGALGGASDAAVLRYRLRSERNDAARLGLLAGLYALNDDAALQDLLKLLESDDFEVRTGTAATLVRSVADASIAALIRAAIRNALSRERSVNARYRFRQLLKEIERRFPKSRRKSSRLVAGQSV